MCPDHVRASTGPNVEGSNGSNVLVLNKWSETGYEILNETVCIY